MTARLNLGSKLSKDFLTYALLEHQKVSYDEFFSDSSSYISLEKNLKALFPITDAFGRAVIEYTSYRLGSPAYNESECLANNATYASALYVTLRLSVFDIDENSGESEISAIKEQEVHLCDIPLMSANSGSFILNGVQRVIVSQIHKAPGVFFGYDPVYGINSYTASIVPYRGNWLDLEFDAKGVLFFRINKRRKVHICTLLSAIGCTKENIIDIFCAKISIKFENNKCILDTKNDSIRNSYIPFDLFDSDGAVILPSGDRVTKGFAQQYPHGYIDTQALDGLFLASDVTVDGHNFPISSAINESVLALFAKKNVEFTIVNPIGTKDYSIPQYINASYKEKMDAMADIVRLVRQGITLKTEMIEREFANVFSNNIYYDLSDIGRYKMNLDLKIKVDQNITSLTSDDIIASVKKLLDIRYNNESIDDIDSLKNRRVRGVGELFSNAFRVALGKLARVAFERLNASNIELIMPSDVISSNVLAIDIREFFLRSKLSQFIDQTNPLSEVVHKRRISSLGPGGLNREHAGFSVRDVHYTHYGRICPIETPEGSNIGLINSLALYSKINKYGFISSPYRVVVDGKITDTIEYLDAIQEADKIIAQLDKKVVENNILVSGLISCRINDEYKMYDSKEVQYIEYSPRQVISVASSLIPFIECDDASRALMGANMQRQAVPLVRPSSPLVGTGVEKDIINNTASSIIAKNSGVIYNITDQNIYIKTDDIKNPFDIYEIRKFQKTNQSTCFHHNVVVTIGQAVSKGQILADGSSSDAGELALGQNLLTAFVAWHGYNFEDAIVISDRVAKSEVYTSIHIEEYEITIRDTRLGAEEITRSVPNLADEALTKLDESGVVLIGANVIPGDILVGRVTPKTEDVVRPEERLLQAIFGEKNSQVKNTSLIVPPGVNGTVVDVKIFTRPGVDKIDRARENEYNTIEKMKKELSSRLEIINSTFSDELNSILAEKDIVSTHKTKSYNAKVTLEDLKNISLDDRFKFVPLKGSDSVKELKAKYDTLVHQINAEHTASISKILDGSELPQGVLMSVKIYVAIKRKLQPGDKMAGRHGNKGVVSIVLPVEDMPFMADGSPVDIVLNPLGVPRRMNVGQILEIHLGMVARKLGSDLNKMVTEKATDSEIKKKISSVVGDSVSIDAIDSMGKSELHTMVRSWSDGVRFATPAFDGASDQKVGDMLEALGIARSGQFDLFDGRTGEKFERPVTIGVMYMLKLHHLVEEKIHARSVGSYSLVTQQPLGGRVHFGGQRLGEMECWALQAYGAAYTLQEMLTVKSDDIEGRSGLYSSIIRGDNIFSHNTPESFNVMIKELRSLCMNVDLEYASDFTPQQSENI